MSASGRTLLTNIGQLVTCKGPAPRRGRDLGDPGIRTGTAVLVEGSTIAAVGPEDDLRRQAGAHLTVFSAGGNAVVPGFVDAHTHAVFAGTRAGEFEARIAGKTYREILEAGGGILNTVDHVRRAGRTGLATESKPRLARMLALGTTTAEVKSGYGLSIEAELMMLETIGDLRKETPVELIATFLGAHAVPRGMDRADYVRLVVEEMIPAVAAQGIAHFIDVFCDAGAFDCPSTRRILEAGKVHRLIPKLHADEIESIGGTPLALETHCISVDHLERISAADVQRLAKSPTVGVLLPGTAFILNLPSPPARALIDAGAAIALATDLNPGTCYTESIPMIQTFACAGLRMTPAEALLATTLNAAAALGIADRVGSVEPGKQADLVVLESNDYREIPYHFGYNPVRAVFKGGRLVHGTLDQINP